MQEWWCKKSNIGHQKKVFRYMTLKSLMSFSAAKGRERVNKIQRIAFFAALLVLLITHLFKMRTRLQKIHLAASVVNLPALAQEKPHAKHFLKIVCLIRRQTRIS